MYADDVDAEGDVSADDVDASEGVVTDWGRTDCNCINKIYFVIMNRHFKFRHLIHIEVTYYSSTLVSAYTRLSHL